MSQDAGKFLYFKVGLLKDSDALDALWQDALKHHMVDQPEKLMALRLTEYYEMIAQGVLNSTTKSVTLPPAPHVGEERVAPASNASAVHNYSAGGSGTNYTVSSGSGTNQTATVGSGNYSTQSAASTVPTATGARPAEMYLVDDIAMAAPQDAQQNAEDAADYWSLL